MSQLRRFPFRPMEAPPPNITVPAFQAALQKALEAVSKRETQMVRFVPGCDGRAIVTAYQGSCQDQARAVNGGQAAVAVDLGNGARVVLARDLGRGYSASSGYSGAGLSSGAFPSPLSGAAVDLALDPIDSVSGVAIEGAPADMSAALAGATIEGRIGESKRLAVCYGAAGAAVWDDILIGSEAALSGLSINPNYIAAMGGDKYALTRLYENTVSLTDAGAEASTSDLPVFTGTGSDFAYSAIAFSRDRDTMAVLVNDNTAGKHGIHIGTSMLTAPSWATLDLGSTFNFQVYGTRALSFGADDTLYAACHVAATYQPKILVIEAPYPVVTQVLTPSWIGVSGVGQWNDPSPLAISRDGRYMAAGAHGSSGVADIWELTLRTRIRTLAPTGYTLTRDIYGTGEQGYGAMAFGPDGRLFALLRKTADGSYHLGVWTPPFSAAAEIISLGMSSPPYGLDWLSVSGDGQVVAILSSTAGDILIVEPPYTSAGATVTSKTLSGPIEYQFEFDPSEAYALAPSLTLTAVCRSIAESGGSLEITTRLTYGNGGAAAAFGVLIEFPLPSGNTFVSATDGGLYDSHAGTVRWLVPSVAAAASGYVEMVTRRA